MKFISQFYYKRSRTFLRTSSSPTNFKLLSPLRNGRPFSPPIGTIRLLSIVTLVYVYAISLKVIYNTYNIVALITQCLTKYLLLYRRADRYFRRADEKT